MHHQDDLPPFAETSAGPEGCGPRPSPAGPTESRRIPPHGDVSPDGSRPWPHPSRQAKWLVLGGTVLGAAALTAGTVLAARQLLGFAPGKRPVPPPVSAAGARTRPPAPPPADRAGNRPRFAGAGRPPRPAPPPRQGLLQEVEANTASLTNGVENVMQALTAAMAGFRSVAGQAGSIMQEFGDAAAMMRGILDRKPAAPPRSPHRQDPHDPHMPDLRDDPLLHDPMEGPEPDGPADHDPRIHRL